MGVPRPVGLFDREQEWADLARLIEDSRPGVHLGVVTGRRRQGKSFLLRSLTSTVGGIYHQAQEVERPQALQRFARDTAMALGLPVDSLHFADWGTALRTALGLPPVATAGSLGSSPARLLIIDELPYLLAHSPELPSVMQEIIDEAAVGQASRTLIVCGSALSVMADLLSGAKPLHGRAQLNMTVRPFDYRTAARYWGISDPDIAFHVDAILGGTAGYRALIDVEPPMDLAGLPTWLAATVLNPSHALFGERDYILREDPRITDKRLYNSVLSAVAGGARSVSQIGGVVGRDSNQLRHPLEVLTSAGFLHRSEDVLRQKRATHRIADPLVRFSEVVRQPYEVLLEQRDALTAWSAAQEGFRAQILGPHFESLCREWTAGQSVIWREPIGVVGTTVVNDAAGRSQLEIDVVALPRGASPGRRDSRVVVLGEAKSSHRRRTIADLDHLRRAQNLLVAGGTDASDAALVVFGRGGFDTELQAVAQVDPQVMLVDLAELYRARA